MHRYFIILLALTAFGCSHSEIKEPLEYKGPLSEAEVVEMFYTEKDRIKVKMTAPLLYEYQNGDRELPKGVYMEFYDDEGTLESTLRANEAYFFKEQNQWRGRGNVEVKNLKKKEQINTEELFWKPGDKKIFTEKFFTLHREDGVIYGRNLETSEDLSDYSWEETSAELEVDD